jgi:hypothetical protein
MRGTPPGVVQVVGRARPADRVTATARGLRLALAELGHPGRVVAVRREDRSAGIDEIGALAAHERVVLHTVDGGEDLAPAVRALEDRAVRITVVHHGSAPGSDRAVLRALRGRATHATAADPVAREELRSLGYGSVAQLDAAVLDRALDDVEPDPASVDNLAGHAGPLTLSVGPCEPAASLERLLDAFAEMVTTERPSGTLSLCGPPEPWYVARLRRHIVANGLVACELLSPATDAQVMARLDRAAAVVDLHPVGLDPVRQTAARRGIPIVAPLVAATADVPDDQLVAVAPRPSTSELAAALAAATDPARVPARSLAPPPAYPPRAGRELERALGLR